MLFFFYQQIPQFFTSKSHNFPVGLRFFIYTSPMQDPKNFVIAIENSILGSLFY